MVSIRKAKEAGKAMTLISRWLQMYISAIRASAICVIRSDEREEKEPSAFRNVPSHLPWFELGKKTVPQCTFGLRRSSQILEEDSGKM